MIQLLFSRKADADLDEIWQFIANNTMVAADRTLDRIRDAILRLLDYPQSGQACPEIASNLRRSVVGNFVIYYQFKSNPKTILIVRILHGARDTDQQSFDESAEISRRRRFRGGGDSAVARRSGDFAEGCRIVLAGLC